MTPPPMPSTQVTTDRRQFGAMADDELAAQPEWVRHEYGADNLTGLRLLGTTWYGAATWARAA